MTSLLVEWVNDELQLEPPLTEETLAEELGSGFILGALLHRHNQLAEHERLRRRDTADARIENFCVLEPTLASLGVRFDANAALGIMNAKPGAAAMVLYQLKVQLEKLAKEKGGGGAKDEVDELNRQLAMKDSKIVELQRALEKAEEDARAEVEQHKNEARNKMVI